jgi:flagellar biosynthesis/type III secretory pathway chaperone
MGKLLRELNDLIQSEIDLYNKFIRLLKEQWDAISSYSLGSLKDIVEKKEIQVRQMQQLEKKRTALMEKIARLRGVSEKDLTLKKIIQTTVNPIRVKLNASRETLLKQIAAINKLHEGIRGLMDHSSLSLKKSLAFVHSKNEEASAPSHPDGKLVNANLQGRMLNFNV